MVQVRKSLSENMQQMAENVRAVDERIAKLQAQR
jgi:hypothetical protein